MAEVVLMGHYLGGYESHPSPAKNVNVHVADTAFIAAERISPRREKSPIVSVHWPTIQSLTVQSPDIATTMPSIARMLTLGLLSFAGAKGAVLSVEVKGRGTAVFNITGYVGGKVFTKPTVPEVAALVQPFMRHVKPQPKAEPPARLSNDSPATLLRELGKLHAEGLLTDEEFAAKKAEILRRM